MLQPADARALLYSVDVTTPIDLRHRALIGLMVIASRAGAQTFYQPFNVSIESVRRRLLPNSRRA